MVSCGKSNNVRSDLIIKARHSAPSKLQYGDWTWIIIVAEEKLWGKYMAACVLSSVLLVSPCRSLATVPETDQSLTLIRSEWSRRRDRELCDYWTLTLYQFQSFYNTRLSCTRCIMRPVWSAGDPVWFLLIMSDISASFMRENASSDQKCHRLKSADCLERSELRSRKRHATSFVRCTAALRKAAVGHFKTCAFLFQRLFYLPEVRRRKVKSAVCLVNGGFNQQPLSLA